MTTDPQETALLETPVDPWATFRAAKPAPDAGADPWAAFRTGPQPPRESPGMLGYAADMGEQAVRQFNKGLAGLVTAPYRAVDWAAEKITGGGGLPDAETLALYKPFMVQPEAKTEPGRYVGKMAEAVGASAIPTAGLIAAAPRLAAIAPTTVPRAIAQNIGTHVAAAPGTAAAIDIAAAASGGAGVQYAENLGFGPAGQAIAGMVTGMLPGVGMAYRSPGAGRIGTATGENLAEQRARETVRDATAFAEHEVRPFGPAFNQGPVASVAKQLTETPLIGSALRNNLDETYQDAARAAARLADDMSATATPESAGAAVRRGLERFGTAGIADLEPGQLRALNVPHQARVPRATLMSDEAAEAAMEAGPIRRSLAATTATTSRGVTVPAARPLSRTLTTRTTAEDLSDGELARVIRTPAAHTSFAARQEALYEHGWRQMPDIARVTGVPGANTLAAVNTRQAMQQIDNSIVNNISGQNIINRELAERFRNADTPGFSFSDLRAIRTEIGRALNNNNPLQQTLDRTQLRHLYGAVSRDMEIGLETLANRAAIATRGAQPRVSSDDARRAMGALHAFRRADRYTRLGMERMDRFMGVLQAQSPEAAARRIMQAATAGTKGNTRLVRSAMTSLRPEERAEIGSLVVRELGTPNPSARGIVQETGWSAQTFTTRYEAMSPEARALIFTPEHQRAVDGLFRVANRIANVEALANTSRSATNALNVTAAVGAIPSIMAGNIGTPLAIGGSGLAMSILMSRPAYTNWMTRYVELRAAVRSGRDAMVAPLLRHVAGLDDQARANPQLLPALYAVTDEVNEMRGK